MVKISDCGSLVDFFFPSIGQRGDHGIFAALGPNIRLLCRSETHGTLTPVFHIVFVMKFKVLTEFPSSPLLFTTRGTVVRQVGIRIIVKKSRHDGDVVGSSSLRLCYLLLVPFATSKAKQNRSSRLATTLAINVYV
jgi:hypothetical protein